MVWTYNPNAIEPPEPDYYECPVCGAEIAAGSTLFINENGVVVGCEDCIRQKEAAEYFEE